MTNKRTLSLPTRGQCKSARGQPKSQPLEFQAPQLPDEYHSSMVNILFNDLFRQPERRGLLSAGITQVEEKNLEKAFKENTCPHFACLKHKRVVFLDRGGENQVPRDPENDHESEEWTALLMFFKSVDKLMGTRSYEQHFGMQGSDRWSSTDPDVELLKNPPFSQRSKLGLQSLPKRTQELYQKGNHVNIVGVSPVADDADRVAMNAFEGGESDVWVPHGLLPPLVLSSRFIYIQTGDVIHCKVDCGSSAKEIIVGFSRGCIETTRGQVLMDVVNQTDYSMVTIENEDGQTEIDQENFRNIVARTKPTLQEEECDEFCGQRYRLLSQFPNTQTDTVECNSSILTNAHLSESMRYIDLDEDSVEEQQWVCNICTKVVAIPDFDGKHGDAIFKWMKASPFQETKLINEKDLTRPKKRQRGFYKKHCDRCHIDQIPHHWGMKKFFEYGVTSLFAWDLLVRDVVQDVLFDAFSKHEGISLEVFRNVVVDGGQELLKCHISSIFGYAKAVLEKENLVKWMKKLKGGLDEYHIDLVLDTQEDTSPVVLKLKEEVQATKSTFQSMIKLSLGNLMDDLIGFDFVTLVGSVDAPTETERVGYAWNALCLLFVRGISEEMYFPATVRAQESKEMNWSLFRCIGLCESA